MTRMPRRSARPRTAATYWASVPGPMRCRRGTRPGAVPGRGAAVRPRRSRSRNSQWTSIAKGVFIVRQTTMIAACRPTTRRPFRPSLSPSTWSCSRCAATRSARWWYAVVSHRSRGDGHCPAGSSKPMRISDPQQRASWSRRPACAPRIRRPRRSVTAPTSNSSPPTAIPIVTRGCGSSASPTSPWHPICRPTGRRRCEQRAMGVRRRPARSGRELRPGRREPDPAGLRPCSDPCRRGRTRPLQDRVLLPGHRVLPSGVHGRRAPEGVRGGVGSGSRPAELPSQGHRHSRLPGAHRRYDHAPGRSPGPALPGRGGHRAQPPMLRPEV